VLCATFFCVTNRYARRKTNDTFAQIRNIGCFFCILTKGNYIFMPFYKNSRDSMSLDCLQLDHTRQIRIYVGSDVFWEESIFEGWIRRVSVVAYVFLQCLHLLLQFPCVKRCMVYFDNIGRDTMFQPLFSCNYINMHTVHGDLGMVIRTSVMINETVNESWFLNCKALKVTILIYSCMQMGLFENVTEICHSLTYQR
jgi:hypothetical protein